MGFGGGRIGREPGSETANKGARVTTARRLRTRRNVGMTGPCGFLLLSLSAAPAAADDFPGAICGGMPCGTDGYYVTGCWNDEGTMPSELTTVIMYLNGPVAANTNLQFVTGDCDGTTDLAWDDELTADQLPPGNKDALGMAVCMALGGGFGANSDPAAVECESWRATISPSNIEQCNLVPPCTRSQLRGKVWCTPSGGTVAWPPGSLLAP